MQAYQKILNFLYWSPRILAILFIFFLAIFALDVFIPGKTIVYYLVALFIHLIPNFLLAGVLILSWRYEKIGGILFILIALFFTLTFRTYEFFENFLLLSFPALLIGILFIAHNRLAERRRVKE